MTRRFFFFKISKYCIPGTTLWQTPYLEKPRGNETQATGSKNSWDILAHWQTFPTIVGK
jgi:hypothetical protein